MIHNQIVFSRRLLLGAGAATLLSSCSSAVHAGSGTAQDMVRGGAARLTGGAGTAPTGGASAAAPAGAPTPPVHVPAVPIGAVPSKPDYYVHAGPGTMALTFDDGPSPLYTGRVLALLRQYGVTATFFMIGSNIQKYPDVLRQVLAEGHQVGNHTWTHPDLGTLSATEVRDEIERTSDIIAQTGRTGQPTLFRAPGGFFTRASMRVCATLGLQPVSWSVDPRDWSNPGVHTITDRVLAHAHSGSIVLEHDGCVDSGAHPPLSSPENRTQTVEALADYLPRLLDAGYRFTTVGPTT